MRQAAALPYRHAGGSSGPIEVLLVTSSAGRWIIPKGDVDDGMEPHRAAEKEAFEEGGVRGGIREQRIGNFRTCKKQDGTEVPVDVDVFPLEVWEELKQWPEAAKRQRRWLPADEAAGAVDELELAAIIREFSP